MENRLLCTGMGFIVYIFQFLVDDLGIDLGRGNICMAQHFLNGVQVGAVFQQMRGERMAQRVGGCLLYTSDAADD